MDPPPTKRSYQIHLNLPHNLKGTVVRKFEKIEAARVERMGSQREKSRRTVQTSDYRGAAVHHPPHPLVT